MIAEKDFIIGEYVISRSAGVATLPLAYPILDEQGNIKSIVSVGLALKAYKNIFSLDRLPPDSTLMIVDRKGKIMLRMPDENEWLGKHLNDYKVLPWLYSN